MEDVEEFWAGLSLREKLWLRGLHSSHGRRIQPACEHSALGSKVQSKKISCDVFLRIALRAGRNRPETFLRLKLCCQAYSGALPNLFDIFPKRFDIHLKKLIYRLNLMDKRDPENLSSTRPEAQRPGSGTGPDQCPLKAPLLSKRFGVEHARVFDEECRYVRVSENTKCAFYPVTVFRVDKITGLILPHAACTPIGNIFEQKPERTCFNGATLRLHTVNQRKRIDKAFELQLYPKWLKQFQDASNNQMLAGQNQKRRFYAEQWDEGKSRRESLLAKPSRKMAKLS